MADHLRKTETTAEILAAQLSTRKAIRGVDKQNNWQQLVSYEDYRIFKTDLRLEHGRPRYHEEAWPRIRRP